MAEKKIFNLGKVVGPPGPKGEGASTAADVSIVDAGEYFSGDNVEDALRTLGGRYNTAKRAIDRIEEDINDLWDSRADEAYELADEAYAKSKAAHNIANAALNSADGAYDKARDAETEAGAATKNAGLAYSKAEEAMEVARLAEEFANEAMNYANRAWQLSITSYGKALKAENGVLTLLMAEQVEKDNELPVSSAAVYTKMETEVGNINAILDSI